MLTTSNSYPDGVVIMVKVVIVVVTVNEVSIICVDIAIRQSVIAHISIQLLMVIVSSMRGNLDHSCSICLLTVLG